MSRASCIKKAASGIAPYHDHRAEIDRQIEESEKLISPMKANPATREPQMECG
jgi:hypothetical protein